MSELDPVNEALERLEWADSKQEETPESRLRAVTRRAALTGGAAGIASAMLAACGFQQARQREGDGHGHRRRAGERRVAASSPSTNKLKFVLVNHVTTNPFFVPTKYGAEDACKLLGCTYQWTGSENSNVNEMVNAMNTAITSGVNGIGVCLVDKKAFNAPTDSALKAKIPVVAYNADEKSNSPAVLHRPGPVRVRAGDGQQDQGPGARPATWRCSSPRRARRTSSRGSTARRTCSRARARSRRTWSPRARRCRRSCR